MICWVKRWAVGYEIVVTLGPASSGEDIWRGLLQAGASAFRLNTSHLSLDELAAWLERLTVFLEPLSTPPALVLDLQGSKWRLGEFRAGRLEAGQALDLVFAASAAEPDVLPVPHSDFFQAATQSSGEIILNDAKVRLILQGGSGDRLSARVVQGGEISARKGITFRASQFRQEHLSEKDRAIFDLAGERKGVRFAVSYVKDAVEMEKYRSLFGSRADLIAKLERQPALSEARRIAQIVDEVWLCRGDLGAELGLPGMAAAVASFSIQAGGLGKPALLAGQVLEHMKEQPAPTRSEICYLYEALQKGYAGVVLSDETAIGKYPLESCQAAAMFLGGGSRAWEGDDQDAALP